MKNKIKLLCSAVLMAASTTVAAAPAGDAYIGVGFGQARYDVSASDLDAAALAAGFGSSSSSVDDNSAAWKLFAGFRFHENFGIEGGWVDLGDIDTTTVTTGPSATVNGEVEASGLFVDAVGYIPINDRFTLYGKVGVFRADVEARVAVVAGGAAATASADDDSFEAKFGVGLSYDFTEQFGARLEYERYNDVGDDNTGEGDVDLWLLGVYVNF